MLNIYLIYLYFFTIICSRITISFWQYPKQTYFPYPMDFYMLLAQGNTRASSCRGRTWIIRDSISGDDWKPSSLAKAKCEFPLMVMISAVCINRKNLTCEHSILVYLNHLKLKSMIPSKPKFLYLFFVIFKSQQSTSTLNNVTIIIHI